MKFSRAFRNHRAIGYLTPEDRYLAAPGEPELRFAFIGVGIMGQEHIRNTLLEGRATVAGIHDTSAESIEFTLAALAKDGVTPSVYPTVEAAAADPTVDVLVISTPNHTHVDMMRAVAGCDKAIFLEKPLATTLADAAEIHRLASAHERLVQIGLQYRYKAVYREALEEVLTRQVLGTVRSVQMVEHRFPFLDKVGQWNKFDAFTGGTLVEKCCHYFDLMNLFAGSRPTRVFATGAQARNFKDFSRDNRRADGIDQANAILEFANGVQGNFSLNMFTPGSREELVVCGDDGRLHTVESARLGAAHHNHLSLWLGDEGVSRETTPAYPPYIEQAGHHGSTFMEHIVLVDNVLNGSRDGAGLDDALWSVIVAQACQLSIQRGEAVAVEECIPEGMRAVAGTDADETLSGG